MRASRSATPPSASAAAPQVVEAGAGSAEVHGHEKEELSQALRQNAERIIALLKRWGAHEHAALPNEGIPLALTELGLHAPPAVLDLVLEDVLEDVRSRRRTRSFSFGEFARWLTAVEQVATRANSDLAVASKCKASGGGLTQAIVRQRNDFQITAFCADGTRRTAGGDHFFVAIRGCGARVRAKVLDNGDGSYTVAYKPEIAGAYKIAISLCGESLPGSPFRCSARYPRAASAGCAARSTRTQTACAGASRR